MAKHRKEDMTPIGFVPIGRVYFSNWSRQWWRYGTFKDMYGCLRDELVVKDGA